MVACLLSLLGFALRVFFLGQQSLWYDEAFSLAVAQAEPPIFWAALLSDGVHPPGYYLLLRASLALFGDSEFALRYPSALLGTLAVPLIYQLGRTLGGRHWGLMAGLLLALNPFALWYAKEARMYGLLLCLSIAGGYAFWKLVRQPDVRHWLWLTVISALGFVVHYFAFVLSLAQFVYLVVSLRRTHRVLRWWVAAKVVAFLFFLPWAVAIVTREGRNFGIGWIQPATLLDLPLTLSNLALAVSNPTWPWTWAGLALVAGMVATGIVAGPKRSALHALHPTPYSYLLVWLVVPIVFTWLLSLRLPLYVDRFLIICLPPLVLLSSTMSLSPSWKVRGTMTVLIIVSTMASTRLWIDPKLAKEDWRTAAIYVQSMEESGDTLVMRDFQTGIPFGYYYRGALELQVASINQQTTPLDDLGQGYARLWLVYRRPFEATHALAGAQPFTWQDDEEPVTRDWLVSHAPVLMQEMTFPGVYVALYRLTPDEGTEDMQN
jgi:4-amino-4-deoxy-L-arabinose transferase-like glycosyltransferase